MYIDTYIEGKVPHAVTLHFQFKIMTIRFLFSLLSSVVLSLFFFQVGILVLKGIGDDKIRICHE